MNSRQKRQWCWVLAGVVVLYLAGYPLLMIRGFPARRNGVIQFSSTFRFSQPGDPVGPLSIFTGQVTTWNYFYYPVDFLIDGFSKAKAEMPPEASITISTDAPLFAANAILNLMLAEHRTTSPSNSISRSRLGINRPSASGSFRLGAGPIEREERRLIAVSATGFTVVFTRATKDSDTATESVQTNVVLFPYRQTTETNLLGWNIVGEFEIE